MVVCFGGMRSGSWNVLSRFVLKIRTSKKCVVTLLKAFHTWIFCVAQQIDSFSIFFHEVYIANLKAHSMTRSLFFAMSPKRSVNLVVVGSGQNKIPLWDFDHSTKVRLRRDYFTTKISFPCNEQTNKVLLHVMDQLQKLV